MPSASKPTSTASSGLGGMFRSITKSFKGGHSQSSPTQVQPTIVGGAANLETLLRRVASPNSVTDRISAAHSLQTSIDTYSVSSIPEIWYSAQDMVLNMHSPECRRAGISLMISCIQRDDDSLGSRMAYYNSIANNSNLQDIDLQISALKQLTNDGNNLADLFYISANGISKVLIVWFQRLASESQEIRIGRRKDVSKPWGTSMEDNFHSFLRLLSNIFRHNHSLFSDQEIAIFIQEAVAACQKTSSESDIEESLAFINVVLECAFIPIENLPDLLAVLCGVAGLPSRADQAWSIVLGLSKSYISNNTFAHLCTILERADGNGNSNVMRGAAIYLQRLMQLYVEQKRQAEMSVRKVMQAYSTSLVIGSSRHNYEIVCCVYNLLEDISTRNMFTYDIWESDCSPLEILYRIGSTTAIQKAALRPSISDYQLSVSRAPSISSITSGNINKEIDYEKKTVQKFAEIFALLGKVRLQDSFHGPREAIVDFFVDMSQFIDEPSALIVISTFKDAHYCNPLTRNWARNTDELLHRFFRDHTWGSTIRQRALGVFRDTINIAKDICEPPVILELIDKVFENVEDESDDLVFQTMIQMLEDISQDTSPSIFNHISSVFLRFFPKEDKKRRQSLPNRMDPDVGVSAVGSPSNDKDDTDPLEALRSPLSYRKQMIAAAFCKVFVNTFRTCALTARSVYYTLFTICQRSYDDPLSFIEAARLLCRLRASADNYIYLTTPTNMDGLSASVGRNLNGVQDTSIYKDKMFWWFPETIPYLCSDDLETSSYVLKRRTDDPSLSAKLRDSECEIDIALWFNEILHVIEHGGHWEIYSFIWAHFGPQLANIQLFRHSGCDIQKLRVIICEQILNNTKPPPVLFPKDVSRNDIKVTLIRTTSSLLSYHDIFTKRDEDHIVRAFVDGLSTSEKAVVPCIHGLIVSCYELPLSIKKYLGPIFTKFQTKITNSSTSPHILEFLLSLSRLPSLTDNFTQDEYKRVFGMAIKYIQYAYDLAQKEQSPESRVSNAKPAIGVIQNTIDSSNNKVLSQYLLVLAYNVIATWFLTLRLSDRRFMAKFIIRNLILAEGTSDAIDTQSLAYVDIISRFTYSNLDLTVQTTMGPPATQPNRTTKQWIYGSSIVSISTDTQTGDSQIMVRRPTGTSVFNLKPDERMIPGWLEEYFSKLRENDEPESQMNRLRGEGNEIFAPNHFLLQLMIPVDTQPAVKPLPIPNDPAIARAIGAFDRTPVVDFHKVGIMYIGPGQREELEILGNSVGSVHYKKFLRGMGRLVRLKENRKVYTGGLDITNDIDGEYAYVWNDKVTQLIFHTTTMMPPPANPHDTSFASKKRHIGNDFVNIFFDESEVPFEFGLVKSQFNFINISITPISCTFSRSESFIELDDSDPAGSEGGHSDSEVPGTKMFYKVRALCKPGVPAIFAACHLKIVSEDSLPVFIRNLAIISSKFASVWNSQGGYISHWQYRLEQINTLREKVVADIKKLSADALDNSQNVPVPQPTHQRDGSVDKKEDSTVTQSFLDQLTSPSSQPDHDEKFKDSNGHSGIPTFSMDEPDHHDDDMPLLKNLDFSYFT